MLQPSVLSWWTGGGTFHHWLQPWYGAFERLFGHGVRIWPQLNRKVQMPGVARGGYTSFELISPSYWLPCVQLVCILNSTANIPHFQLIVYSVQPSFGELAVREMSISVVRNHSVYHPSISLNNDRSLVGNCLLSVLDQHKSLKA